VGSKHAAFTRGDDFVRVEKPNLVNHNNDAGIQRQGRMNGLGRGVTGGRVNVAEHRPTTPVRHGVVVCCKASLDFS
jgi:hypothetical protein